MSQQTICYLLVALATAACARSSTPKETLVMAWDISTITTLDPDFLPSVNSNEIMNNVCDSIAFMDYSDLSAYDPGLAQSWSSSPDGLTWRFTLRSGLAFPSGRPVRSEDVVWSMRRTLTLSGTSATFLNRLGYKPQDAETHFHVVDDRVFEIHLRRPLVQAIVLPALSFIRILDKTEVLAHELNGDLGRSWLTTHTACAGPFSVTRWNANETIILSRNKMAYWRHPISIERIIIRHVPQPASQRLMLEKGDIDIARNLGAVDVSAIRENPATYVLSKPSGCIVFLGLNQSDDVLRNPKVREAFRYLIDYDTLAKTFLRDYGLIRQAFVPASFFGALPPKERPYSLNIAKARSLLASAGYSHGFTKEVLTPTQSPSLDVAQHLQANALKVGIQLDLRPLSFVPMEAALTARKVSIHLLGTCFSAPDADVPARRFASNPDNSSAALEKGFPTWRVSWDVGQQSNELVEQAQLERDPVKRRQIYFLLQRAQLKDSPLIPIYESTRVLGLSKAVTKIQVNGPFVFYAAVEKK